jgi:hypothetical protein
MAWSAVHIPFIMSFVLAAAALSKLVLATDCSDTKLEDLTETYMLKSEPEIPIGLRWFYCTGLGIALACMGKSPSLSSSQCSNNTRYNINLPRTQRPSKGHPSPQIKTDGKSFCSLHHPVLPANSTPPQFSPAGVDSYGAHYLGIVCGTLWL